MKQHKYTARRWTFLSNVKRVMNQLVYARVLELVRAADDIHAADEYLGRFFRPERREAIVQTFHERTVDHSILFSNPAP